MGREIRRVPPNYEHPMEKKSHSSELGPVFMLATRFEDEAKKWKEGFAKWEAGLRPGIDPDTQECVWQPVADWTLADIYDDPNMEYWEYTSPPTERAGHRPWTDAEATWFQVWETVTDGTPVSLPFATPEELVDYLVANGDFWDQSRRAEGVTDMPCGPWSRQRAEAFVKAGWIPSAMFVRTPPVVD